MEYNENGPIGLRSQGIGIWASCFRFCAGNGMTPIKRKISRMYCDESVDNIVWKIIQIFYIYSSFESRKASDSQDENIKTHSFLLNRQAENEDASPELRSIVWTTKKRWKRRGWTVEDISLTPRKPCWLQLVAKQTERPSESNLIAFAHLLSLLTVLRNIMRNIALTMWLWTGMSEGSTKRCLGRDFCFKL